MPCVSDLVWKTKTGREVRVGDMSSAHIDNALRHLEKRHKHWMAQADAAACPNVNPDSMAAYYALQAMDEALDYVNAYEVWIDAFKTEKRRRKKLVDG